MDSEAAAAAANDVIEFGFPKSNSAFKTLLCSDVSSFSFRLDASRNDFGF